MTPCPKCKTEVPGGESYCPKCFEPVEQPKKPGWWRRFLNGLFGPPTQVTIATQTAFTGFQRIEYVDPATGERKQAQSFDDIPESQRPQFEELQRTLQTKGAAHETRFIFRDMTGQEHVYKSPDEMPPEIRALYEQIRKLAEGKLVTSEPSSLGP
jgi:hypothetical protein